MRSFYLTFIVLMAMGPLMGQTIWNGPNVTFTKAAQADWTMAENQDRMTDIVWITRASTKGIFNIFSEEEYDGEDVIGGSPADTQWGFGTLENIDTITFVNWAILADGAPPELVGEDIVVHLVTDDIYLSLKFLSWAIGMNGGGAFSYERSSPGPSNTSDLKEKSSVVVSPNPSSDFIRLSKLEKPGTLQVFDQQGRRVMEKSVRNNEPISVDHLSSGTYYLTIDERKVGSFVKN